LEAVGERWTLLVVRDLLLGPRRFTDLARTLAGITPQRLTDRLRRLEAVGLVRREPGEGRQVWYRLTESGRDLGPVVEALTVWGIKHRPLARRPGEPVPPEPLMHGTRALLVGWNVTVVQPVAWVWRFRADSTYTLRYTGTAWQLSRERADPADVLIDTTAEAWHALLTAPPGQRRLTHPDFHLAATAAAREHFAAAFALGLGQAVQQPN
jgi:DNA-binding HxlR family transcriptional regulator